MDLLSINTTDIILRLVSNNLLIVVMAYKIAMVITSHTKTKIDDDITSAVADTLNIGDKANATSDKI